MKVNKKWYVVLALIVAISSIMVSAQSRRMGLRSGMAAQAGPMLRLGAFLRGLDLTEAQKEQVKTIIAGYKPEFQAMVKEQATARNALQDVIRANPNNQELWRSAFKNVTDTEWNILLLREKVRQEIYKLLTPEQIGKIDLRRSELGRRGSRWLD